MPRTPMLLLLAVLAAACNSGDTTDEDTCTTSDECPAGQICDPVQHKCISGSAVADARPADGSTSDARTVDAAPQIDAAPGTVATTLTPGFDPARPYNGATAPFTFTSNPAGATFECKLDGGAFGPCTSPSAPTVSEGAHTFTVRARLGAIVETAPPSVSFTIDRTPPAFTLTGADADAAAGKLTIRYTLAPAGDASGLTYTDCSLDGVPCSCGPAQATCDEVSAGDHTFTIAARDAASNQGPPASNGAPYLMSYGPGSGRAVLMGHDFSVVGDQPKAMLRAAFGEVPHVLRKLAFTRKLRVATVETTAVAAAEVSNALGAVAGLYDATALARVRTTTAAALDVALRSRDVLLVFDQQSSATSAAAGKNWGLALKKFLDAGGVVVVLDGLDGAGAPSQTHRVLSESGLLGVDGAIPIESAFAGEIHKVVTPAEVVNSDVSPLAPKTAPLQYTGPATTVVFSDPGNVVQRWIYQRNGEVCGDGCSPIYDPVVIEKVFPAYRVDVSFPAGLYDLEGGAGSPNVVITVGTTPTTPSSRLDCSWVILGCPAPPCSGSCPVGRAGELRTPSKPADYDLEVRLVDEHGVAGEAWHHRHDIRPLYISDYNPQLSSFHCFNNYTYPKRPVSWQVTKTTGAGSTAYPISVPGNATDCQQTVDMSFTRDESCSAFGNLSYTATITDAGGNQVVITPYSWSPACVIIF